MNKQLKKGFAVLLAVLMLATAVPFASFAAECPDGNHDFGPWATQEPTCTAPGKQVRTCKVKSCGAVETVILDALGHDFSGEELSDKGDEATCTKTGSSYQLCQRPGCGEKGNVKVLPMTDHKEYKEVTKDFLKTPAYCEGPAVYYYMCKTCGIKLDTTYTNGPADPNNHINLDPIEAGTQATCENGGHSTGSKCKDCGKVVEEPKDLPKLSHEAKIPATCTTLAVCKYCDKTFGVLNPDNHVTYTEAGAPVDATRKDEAIPATCTTKGMTEGKTCTKCGKVVVAQTETALAPHTLEAVPAIEPTCTSDGSKAGQKCSVCGHVELSQERIPMLGHDETDWIYPPNFDCTLGGTIYKNCNRCNATHVKEQYLVPANHRAELDPEVPATCIEPGKSAGEHCSVCGYVTKVPVQIAKLEHDYSGEAKSNDNGTHYFKCVNGCEEYGATASINCTDTDADCVCDACGYQFEHQYGEFTSDNNATCMTDGTKTQACAVCGATNTITEEGSKETGSHSFTKFVLDEGTATCTVDGSETATCDLCGVATTSRIKDGSALGHDASEWNYPAGFDCTTGGDRFKLCKRCSQLIENETLIPTSHTPYGDEEVAATCTTPGKTAGSHCGVCNLVIVPQMEIPAKGHSYIETILRPATCSQEGETLYVCANCGHEYTSKTPTAEHSGEWTIVRTETCSEAGYKTRICTVCSQTEAAEIPKLGHTEVTDKGTPATCTESGVSDGAHCIVCGAITTEQVEISPTGHKNKVVTTPATTSSAGKTVTKCSVCGKNIKKVVIAKIKSITLSKTSFEYNGKAQKPTVTVKDANGNKLKSGTDYTVKYSSGRKHIGTYKVVVTFKGNYSGKKTLKFNVTPKIVTGVKATAAKKSVTLKWTAAKYATKYTVYYATSKNGVYSKLGTTSKTTFEATGLKSGKTYYFYVKSLKKTDDGNIYADASVIKKSTTK